MQESKIIEGYLGITTERKLSKVPARLDFWQSATGLFLALFMIAHMFFVASILLGEGAMYKVARFFEGSAFLKEAQPVLVSIVAVIVTIALVVHAFLAVRKFPINFRQYRILKTHKHLMKHSDTSLWFLQALTGFALFFMASVHLYVMFSQPDTIGPNTSAYRFVHQYYWVLYLVLLFAVEVHASVGLYRLCIKWGWFESLGIKNLRAIKWGISVFFIVLGLVTYFAYVKIGIAQSQLPKEHQTMEYFKKFDYEKYGKGM